MTEAAYMTHCLTDDLVKANLLGGEPSVASAIRGIKGIFYCGQRIYKKSASAACKKNIRIAKLEQIFMASKFSETNFSSSDSSMQR